MALKRNLSATTEQEMLKIISDGYDQALAFSSFAQEQQLLAQTRCSPRYYRIEYFTENPRRSVFTIQCNESEWMIKAPLVYLHNYDNMLAGCAAEIITVLKTTRECIQCSSRCAQGAHFQLEQRHKIVCISDAHTFQNLSPRGWADLRRLLSEEIKILHKD